MLLANCRVQSQTWNSTSIYSAAYWRKPHFSCSDHYKLKRPHFGHTICYPCTYLKCPCSFITWNDALVVHQSRVHSTNVCHAQKELHTFSCHLCMCKLVANEREFFVHINKHLRRNEKVCCMFVGCSFQTSIYGTFNLSAPTRPPMGDFR